MTENSKQSTFFIWERILQDYCLGLRLRCGILYPWGHLGSVFSRSKIMNLLLFLWKRRKEEAYYLNYDDPAQCSSELMFRSIFARAFKAWRESDWVQRASRLLLLETDWVPFQAPGNSLLRLLCK